jgi:hypothetical protein
MMYDDKALYMANDSVDVTLPTLIINIQMIQSTIQGK